MNPLIGIWWDNGERIVAISHHVDVNSTGSDLIDSNLEHWSSWPHAYKELGASKADEYFSVPRGRVLHRMVYRRGLIYHGPDTSGPRLERIAEAFGLTDWDSQIDDHYALGSDADSLFYDEE